MNGIMVNVFGKVPNKEYSHNAGWSFVVDDLIGCDVDYYDGGGTLQTITLNN